MIGSRTAPLPDGFGVVLDPDVKRLDEHTLFGGSPARVMRLSPAGRTALAELDGAPVRTRAAGLLARRLSDSGAAHPRPPRLAARPELTVLIPVRDRVAMLDRCLRALGTGYPVLVVDDGSRDRRAVADVCVAHGATLIPRATSGGPAAARNTGLAAITGEFVAFLDSDCVPTPGWIDTIAAHLADPLVGAVAPRIIALPADTYAGRYTAANGSLDLGHREGRVAPGTRLAYLPTAALVVRRTALLEVAGDGAAFDPALRYGEDVDLIWRLHAAGWRMRYDPSVRIEHDEPAAWPALLTRRFRYGTSAGPLALRHPEAMAPLVLHPWPTLTVAGLLARRPAVGTIGFVASALITARTLRRADVPTSKVVPAMLTATRQTWLGVGRYTTQFAAPLLAAALLAPGGPRRWGRRAAAASLLLGPPLTAWAARRPVLDPARFTLAHLADDIAYGAGVWTGAVRARTTAPVRPVIAHQFAPTTKERS